MVLIRSIYYLQPKNKTPDKPILILASLTLTLPVSTWKLLKHLLYDLYPSSKVDPAEFEKYFLEVIWSLFLDQKIITNRNIRIRFGLALIKFLYQKK